MKLVQVFCSRDLEHRVLRVLDDAGVEGYLRMGDATGGKFLPRGDVPRTMTWEAVSYIVPFASEEAVARITRDLRDYAGHCEIEPCLRLLVLPVEDAL